VLEPGLTKSLIGLATVSTDNAVVKFSGTTGNTQNSGVLVDISNNVTGVGALTASGLIRTTRSMESVGSLVSTGASKVTLDQLDLNTSRLITFGPAVGTAGSLDIIQASSDASVYTETVRLRAGRTLLGAPTDDGTTRLQVNGHASASSVAARNANLAFWSGAAFSGGTDPTSASTALSGWAGSVNTQSGGYDSGFVGWQATSTGVVKPTFALGCAGTASWTNGSVGTQTSDFYILSRNNADAMVERLRINSAGTVAIAGAVSVAGQLAPTTDNARTLGTAALQWSDVRSVLGNFTGTVRVTDGTLITDILPANIQLHRPASISYIDVTGIGGEFRLRTSNAGTLDTTPLTITSSGAVTLASTLAVTGAVTASGGITVASAQALTLGNTAVAATPTATHTLTIKDAAGTTYRVLCVV